MGAAPRRRVSGGGAKSVSEIVRKLASLHQAARAMNSILDPDRLLDAILSLLQQVFDLDNCAVLLFDPAEQALRIRAARGYRPDVVKNFRAARGQGVTGRVLESGQPMRIEDVGGHPEYVEGVAGARSEMAAPLCVDDQVIGVLDAESRRASAFLESDLDLFMVFASQAATAIRNAGLVRQLEERSRRLEKTVGELALLNRLGRQMNSTLSLDLLLEEVLHLAQKALSFDACAVLLREKGPDGEHLVVRAALGYRDEVRPGLALSPGQGITGRVLDSGLPLLVPDVRINGRYIPGMAGGRCEMAAPLIVRDRVIGVLDAESATPNAFGEEELRLFGTFASWAAVAIHNAEIHSRVERQKAELDRNLVDMERMNRELRDTAVRIERANRELEGRVRDLETLQAASRAITASLNLDDTLATIVRMTREIVKSSSCVIRLLGEERHDARAPDPGGGDLAAAPSPGGAAQKSCLDLPLKVGNRIIGYFELGSLEESAFSEEQRRVLQVLASQAAIAIENARLFQNTQQTYFETIRSLAQALEARDAYTKGHSERVTRYAVRCAEKMGLPEPTRRLLQYAGLLHDIGKIGISDSILHKRMSLTEQDWKAIRNHPLFGDTILEPIRFLNEAQKIVLCHHERYDGSGYPGRLKGEGIPLEARIVAVADAFDAMTSDRPYRAAMSLDAAMAEVRAGAGRQFDPAVVEAFLAVIESVYREVHSAGDGTEMGPPGFEPGTDRL
mgnify:CR=1 FL=1